MPSRGPDLMNGQRTKLLVLLLIFLVSISSLSLSIEQMYFGPEERPPTLDSDASGEMAQPLWGETYGDVMKYAWYAILTFMVVVSITAVSYAAYKKDTHLLKEIGVLVVAGILFVGMFYTGTIIAKNSSAIPWLGGNPGGNDTANLDPNATAGQLPEGEEHPFFVYLMGLVFLVSALALIVFTFYYLSSMRHRPSDDTVEAEDLSEIVRRTIDELWTGDDPRSSIIRCYADMSALIEKKAIDVKQEPWLTPREFLEAAEGRVPVSHDKLETLTFLFEEARYSPHELSEEMVERARQTLLAIDAELSSSFGETADGKETAGGRNGPDEREKSEREWEEDENGR